ncbi:hypothetical protein [Pelagibius sp. 7325]|uniref:hypothetical protein n=1 Tax=Pelagibius sp. 7325 TaxID=3131994 RepID=UPI0030EDCF81
MHYGNLYFHVGLHKTATTYLQRLVFPRWAGIKYLRYRNIEYFLRLSDSEKYLISCEGLSGGTFARLDDRLRGLRRLAAMFPGSHAIIGLRPHGGFVASLYSQYLRYGGSAPFEAFFSLDGPQENVVWRREDLSFRALIEQLETAFGEAPFVFQMSELKTNRDGLMADLSAFLGTPGGPPPEVDDKAQNISLGAWQGHLLRTINRRAGVSHTPDGRNRPFPRLARWRLDPTTICHKVLGRLPGGPLVSGEVRQRIDAAYRDDWDFVTDYIKSLSCRHL